MKKTIFSLINLFLNYFYLIGAFLWNPHPPKMNPKFHRPLETDFNMTTVIFYMNMILRFSAMYQINKIFMITG